MNQATAQSNLIKPPGDRWFKLKTNIRYNCHVCLLPIIVPLSLTFSNDSIIISLYTYYYLIFYELNNKIVIIYHTH